MEIWKSIVGYEGLYEVSNLGMVKSLSKTIYCRGYKYRVTNEIILKSRILKNGYEFIKLIKKGRKNGFTMHRLVGLHFIPNPNNLPCVLHKDETLFDGKLNNGKNNLYWGTQKDNMRDMIDKGRNKYKFEYDHPYKGKFGNHLSKKVNQYSLQGEFIREWNSLSDIQRELLLDHSNLSKCCLGKKKTFGGFIWKYS